MKDPVKLYKASMLLAGGATYPSVHIACTPPALCDSLLVMLHPCEQAAEPHRPNTCCLQQNLVYLEKPTGVVIA
jgi:hypothetical protein